MRVAVVGLGAVGSGAAWALARRGVEVVGFDPRPLGHDRGSSHGRTRLTRLAYAEDPRYVPLLRRSFTLWEELEQEVGEALYLETGLLSASPAGGAMVGGVGRSAASHGLVVEALDADGARARAPGLEVPEPLEFCFDPRAGVLRVERCVLAMAERARALGAELRVGVGVQGWREEGSGVVVETEAGEERVDGLVVAAGAWTPRLLPALPLEVVRKVQLWFPCADPAFREEAGFPSFFFETQSGVFYGFPVGDPPGSLKVAQHSDRTGRTTADGVDRALRAEDVAPVAAFLARFFPAVGRMPSAHAVCLYTCTPDDHFVVERRGAVAYAAGLSGHGFKMAPALGEALAALALGEEASGVDFLGSERFA